MIYLLSDMGGVWSKPFFDNYTARTHSTIEGWGANTGLEPYRAFMKSFERGYLRGLSQGEEFWRDVMEHFNVEPLEERVRVLMSEFRDSFNFRKEIVEWIKSHRNDLKIGILSNTYAELKPLLMHHSELYDFLVCSCDHGVLKPDEEIYRIAFGEFRSIKSGIEESEIYFIDDKEKNVVGAENFGYNALLYEGLETFESIL